METIKVPLPGGKMKNFVIAGAIALSTSFSFADQDVNIKKVNKVIKSVVQSEVTPTINKIELVVDENSNFESVEKLRAGASISLAAEQSVWSKRASTVDATGEIKTVQTDPAHTKAQLTVTLGSRTDAISLYAYIASKALDDLENDEPNPSDAELIALLKDATLTSNLEQIPAQLERLIVIVKSKIAQVPEDDDKPWSDLMNSLKVNTKVLNNQTTEVVLKTTTEVAMKFFDDTILVSDLSLRIRRGGLSFGGKIATTVETSLVTDLINRVKNTLSMIENSDSETLTGLKETISNYVHMAETIVKGETK